MPSDLAKTNMKSRISDAAGAQLFSYVIIYVLSVLYRVLSQCFLVLVVILFVGKGPE